MITLVRHTVDDRSGMTGGFQEYRLFPVRGVFQVKVSAPKVTGEFPAVVDPDGIPFNCFATLRSEAITRL